MGGRRRFTKKYSKRKTYFNILQLKKYKEYTERFGLKNKKEIHKAEEAIKKIQRALKKAYILSQGSEQGHFDLKIMLERIKRLELLENPTLEDALSLPRTTFLERRLQTIVHKLGISKTVREARQFISHGKIYFKDKRMKWRSVDIMRSEEKYIIKK